MTREIDQLREFSARLGADIKLVQGSGGNTSAKQGEILVVKASGKRLALALREEIFVSVPLDAARHGATPVNGALRPSIETILHAILPFRVVAHVHSVDVLAEAVRLDAEVRLKELLGDLDWAFVPYVKPGEGLARAVAAASQGRTKVFVLGNHGLLVGDDDFAACEATLATVCDRVRARPRAVAPHTERLRQAAMLTKLTPANQVEAHWSALDPVAFQVASAGTLYPDHVVFLGRGASVLASQTPPPTMKSKLFLLEGVGAFLHVDAPPAAHEMAACLGMVAARVAPDAPLRVLTTAEEDDLLNWDAEKHRQKLAEG